MSPRSQTPLGLSRPRSIVIRLHSSARTLSLTVVAASAALATGAHAQGPAFQSPGLSPYSTMGQVNRFSTEFNPAMGGVIDAFLDYSDPDAGEDGFDTQLRLMELNVSSFIDPNMWGYVVLVSEGGEGVEVEEAALEYIGFDSNLTLRAGRFFVDFGKQMQNHLEELRTLERPLPLREYLGEELAGTGVQADWWTPLGDNTPFRVSLGAFSSLAGGHEHGEEEGEEEAEILVPERKDFDEFSITARATVLHELDESSSFQVGSSLRLLPEFAFENDANPAAEATGLSNSVLGFDVTYGWTGETGDNGWLLGGEYLIYDGDLSAELIDPDTTPGSGDESFGVFDDSVSGAFAFADYRWNNQWSTGVQYSWAELPEGPDLDATELELYATWHQTDMRRLRLGVISAENDLEGDSTRAYLQLTAFIGSHTHGLNW